MSLYIYDRIEDIPKGVKIVQNNDSYFKRIPLVNDEFTNHILKCIDKASYRSPTTFFGRDGDILGGLNKDLLSTGTKTLLNIHYSSGICFNVVECGINALYELVKIKKGYVYWGNCYLYLIENHDCDIIVDNKQFLKLGDFLEYQEGKRHG